MGGPRLMTLTGEQYPLIVAILDERRRQSILQSLGRFKHTVDDPAISDLRRLAILAEEFGEVSYEVNTAADRHPDQRYTNLRTELIQLASVCVAWLERIDQDSKKE